MLETPVVFTSRMEVDAAARRKKAIAHVRIGLTRFDAAERGNGRAGPPYWPPGDWIACYSPRTRSHSVFPSGFPPWSRAAPKLDIDFETQHTASMYFKRNQVEEAISRTFGERTTRPSSKLRTRLKRLLDLDRGLKRNARSTDPERANYAFYTSEAPGKGLEVLFSIYDVCALMLGVRLLEHGWPQNFVIGALRRSRRDLDHKFRDILQAPPPNTAALEPQAGEMAFANQNSPFLLIVSDLKTDDPKDGPYPVVAENQHDAFRFQLEKAGRSCSWFELEGAVRALHHNLLGSLPRKRGRSS